MNPRLELLQPYPFEKLRALLATARPQETGLRLIDLSIGEPKHAAPELARQALVGALEGLSGYPPTKGDPALRQAISAWLGRRYGIDTPDPETQILPVLGSREALFAFAQTVIDPASPDARVVCPNPFYQIYEGAALLAGAKPYFINTPEETRFLPDWRSVPDDVWMHTQLVYTCSPGNPAGSVMPIEEWKLLFELSDRYGFVIASDECYSEIYLDENAAPLGALQAAWQLGRKDFSRLVVFSSLSKRSNLPGLRSGFVTGDASIISRFLLYRTYHGSAMSGLVTAASLAAWNDEAHVVANRDAYRAKFDAVLPILEPVLDVTRPEASFYLWAGTRADDMRFTHDLLDQQAVRVLPGSYVSRESGGVNPGAGRIRIALVAPLEECVEAAHRIATFVKSEAKSR
ncbi:succinyldiaminopimelate transaminase [Orrella marina]|uniref:Succinyldiaminopimelate transaminase n=1 Tax=Orrella marina TaxID=2163011 RepID=A0A2R4XHP8_9BURK|nr:succinyldiaminopimelate transaminase [Orrella marina]AWB33337.1 succinyldiaminopimelate transaminase [Orrella marina]